MTEKKGRRRTFHYVFFFFFAFFCLFVTVFCFIDYLPVLFVTVGFFVSSPDR